MKVFIAGIEHLEAVSVLFDQYRVFYQQVSDLKAARLFLQERLNRHDSIIFVAGEYDEIIGFTQLYPSFSSVSLRQIWILNDLFVAVPQRRRGVAQLLMETAKQYAQETNAIRITLSTQQSNDAAQALYESLGYEKDEVFYHYSLWL